MEFKSTVGKGRIAGKISCRKDGRGILINPKSEIKKKGGRRVWISKQIRFLTVRD